MAVSKEPLATDQFSWCQVEIRVLSGQDSGIVVNVFAPAGRTRQHGSCGDFWPSKK